MNFLIFQLFIISALTTEILPAVIGQCRLDDDCSIDQACVNGICDDPCAGSCAENSSCTPLYHGAYCICNDGYTGDPFEKCYVILDLVEQNLL